MISRSHAQPQSPLRRASHFRSPHPHRPPLRASPASQQPVLQYRYMSNTLTVRLPDDLLDWLKETSRRTGIPMGQLVRERLESARAGGREPRFMRFAGVIKGGPPDVSSRKGFSRK